MNLSHTCDTLPTLNFATLAAVSHLRATHLSHSCDWQAMLQAELQALLQAELGSFPAFFSDGERLGQQKARGF
jgi:hypothetical protein